MGLCCVRMLHILCSYYVHRGKGRRNTLHCYDIMKGFLLFFPHVFGF